MFGVHVFNFAMHMIGFVCLVLIGMCRPQLKRPLVGVMIYAIVRIVFYVVLFYWRLVLGIWEPSAEVTLIATVSSSVTEIMFAAYAVYYIKHISKRL